MKTKLWLLLAGAAFVWLTPDKVGATGACTAPRVHGWQDMGCNQKNPGAGGVPQAKCPDCFGMPRWWVSEPYINLCLGDTPLSYTLTSGQPMNFSFYYRQRTVLPETDEIPTYYLWQNMIRTDDNYPKVANCGTNAAWNHNWNLSMVFWDATWESDPRWAGGLYPSYAPFTHNNYEVLVFRPEGGLNYFYSTNGGVNTSLRDPASQIRLVPSSGTYPLTNKPVADANGFYWGTNTAGFKLVYPDGSQDVFGMVVYANAYGIPYNHGVSTTRAYLSQRIDPQGRATQLGYERVILTGAFVYRLKYVVDADGRTNQFLYTTTNNFQVAEIDDPYARKTTLGYDSFGLLTNITDAVGMSNSLQYSSSILITNPIYCFTSDTNDTPYVCGYNVVPASGAGWITSLNTPYGTTAFTYYEADDSTVIDGIRQRAIYISEPEGAQQLYYYLHNGNGLLASTATSPTNIPGQSNFDDGTAGTNHPSLAYRNSIYWGRRQLAALSSNVVSSLPSNMSNALANLTTNDFRKGRVRNWLWQSDNISISELLGSERDPSPDAAGQVEGLRTWYNYTGKPWPETGGSNPQITCVARVLPDGTSQYTTYNYYPVTGVFGIPPGSGFVSTNQSSYSKPDGTIGVLTNWYTYSTNSVDVLSVSNSAGQRVNLGYNSSHQITSLTNALNQVTTLSWNPNLTGIQWPGGESVSLYYGGPDSGRLTSILWSPSGRYVTFNTYSQGLPTSVSNDRGLTVLPSWDNLNRLTGILFPGGTTISNVYNWLDLGATQDRLGNWTYYSYDGLQHLTVITNANNAVTTLSWCGCGSLTSILDALTNLTTPELRQSGQPDEHPLSRQHELDVSIRSGRADDQCL